MQYVSDATVYNSVCRIIYNKFKVASPETASSICPLLDTARRVQFFWTMAVISCRGMHDGKQHEQ